MEAAVHVSTAALDISARIAACEKRIVMHAGVYGNFAVSAPHREAIEAYLHKENVTLDVLAVPHEGISDGIKLHWFDEFCVMLRQDFPQDELDAHFADSWRFLNELAERFGDKGLVRIHHVKQMPSAPMLIFDDVLLAGTYLHSRITAPEGLWVELQADMDKLLDATSLSGRELRQKLSVDELTVFRYVDDAMQAAENNLLCL